MTFKELMDLIRSRIEYRQQISETPQFRHPYSALKHITLEFWYSGDFCMDIEFTARRERNTTLPPWELTSTSASATTTYLRKEFLKAELRCFCTPLCFFPISGSTVLRICTMIWFRELVEYVLRPMQYSISLYSANGGILVPEYVLFLLIESLPWIVACYLFSFAIVPEFMIGCKIFWGWLGPSIHGFILQNVPSCFEDDASDIATPHDQGPWKIGNMAVYWSIRGGGERGYFNDDCYIRYQGCRSGLECSRSGGAYGKIYR